MRKLELRLLALGALTISMLAAGSSGCLFPKYIFDLDDGTGGMPDGGTGTGGTGGGGMTEDCLNGVDDNGDGKIDCEDPECQTDYECVDPIPQGWETPGYVALYTALATETPPDCPKGMATKIYTGGTQLEAAPTTCSSCGCAPASGESCQLTSDLDTGVAGVQPMRVENAAACAMGATQNSSLSVPASWDGSCFHSEMLAGGQTCGGQPCNVSVLSTAATVTGGMCMPTGGVADKPMPTFQEKAFACYGVKNGGGCIGTHVCKPKFKPPFKPHVCIEAAGDVACPAGNFSNKYVYYSDYDDTRDCSKCTCGSPSGGSCEITLSLFSDQACTSMVSTFKAGNCGALTGNPAVASWTGQVTKAPSGSTCVAGAPSTPMGGVTPKIPTTFCCE
jgi:hypothetical protein